MTNIELIANSTEEELNYCLLNFDLENKICKEFNSIDEEDRKVIVKKLIKRAKKEVELKQIQSNEVLFNFNKSRKNAIELKPNSNFIKFYKELDDYFLTHNMMGLEIEFDENLKGLYWYNTGKINKIYMSSCIKIFDENICNCTFLPCSDGIELYRIEVYNTGKGTGSILMNAFNEVSKKTGIKIRLTLGKPGINKEYTKDDAAKQRKFYHKHGFRRSNKNEYWYNI